MNALWSIPLVVAAALLFVAGVLHLGDQSLLVPPPESVAESFVRAVVGGRYGPAQALLSKSLSRSPELHSGLKRLHQELAQAEQVEGLPGTAGSERASAKVRVTIGGRQLMVGTELLHEQGEWKLHAVGAPVPGT